MKVYYLIPAVINNIPERGGEVRQPKYYLEYAYDYSGSYDEERDFYIALISSKDPALFQELDSKPDVIRLDGKIASRQKLQSKLGRQILGSDDVNFLLKLQHPLFDKSQLRIYEEGD